MRCMVGGVLSGCGGGGDGLRGLCWLISRSDEAVEAFLSIFGDPAVLAICRSYFPPMLTP